MRSGVDNFSLSATHSDRLRAARREKTSSSNHEAWRNSKAAQIFGGRSPRKASKTARSFFRFGGSWNRIAPSLSPSDAATWQNDDTIGPTFFRRLSWVILRDAFNVSL